MPATAGTVVIGPGGFRVALDVEIIGPVLEDDVPAPGASIVNIGTKEGLPENWAAFPPGGGRGSGVPFAEYEFESSPFASTYLPSPFINRLLST